MVAFSAASHVRRRPSNFPLAPLALTAGVALLLAVWLMLDRGFTANLLGIRLRLYNYQRPLGVGMLSAVVLLYGGRTVDWARRSAIVCLAVGGALCLIGVARQAVPMVPEGDMAVLESYTMLAAQGDLFVGPYSRFGWNHPGPLYFYLLVPFHVLSGQLSVGLWAGALTINLAAIAAAFWIAMRMQAPQFAFTLAAAITVYLWRVAEILASPWNPHVLVLPLMMMLVMAAAVMTGAFRFLPLLAFVATGVAQTHVGLVPTVLVVCAVATVVGLWREAVGPSGAGWIPARRVLNVTIWTILALWFLPIAQEVHGFSGNLTQLWEFFFTEVKKGEPFQSAFTAWAEVLTGVLHPWFRVGWGNLYVAADVIALRVVAVGEVLLLAALAFTHRRQGRQFLSALSGVLCLASVLACWSVTRVEAGIPDHGIFWISGLGVLNVAVLLEGGLRLIPFAVRLPMRHIAVTACALAWALSAVLGLQFLEARVARSTEPSREERRAEYFVSEVITYLQKYPSLKPLIRIDQDAWVFTAGGVVQLQKAKLPFAVERAWESMFTEATAPRGDENAVVVYARQPHYDELMKEPGRTLLAAHEGTFIVLDTTGQLLRD